MNSPSERKKLQRRQDSGERRGARLEAQIRQSCFQLLMPLAKLMLRAGIGAGELADLGRRAFVMTAANDLSVPRRRPNISRIAVATGLTRQEVARVLGANRPTRKMELKQLQRANRVLAGWFVDPRYALRQGHPRPLQIRGSGATFHRLVRTYGGDVPPRAVLDELRRASAIRATSNGSIVPRRRYVEYGIRSQRDLQDVSEKLRRLAETLSYNLNFPAAAMFEDVALTDRLKGEHYPIAVRRLTASARRFLSAASQYLGREERQAPATRRRGQLRSLGVGIYLFSKPR